ncbi:MAG: hypothetical protein IJR17_07555 [Clostridia bacterium]|nr:hypothetical protein [Clostridia bacterium]
MQVEQDFFVRLEDTGTDLGLSNKGYITMMSNLACLHGTRIGQGLGDRDKCHLSWVVVGWHLEVLHRPKMTETVHGITWAQQANRLQTGRDFLLHDEAGRLCAKGTSAWMVLDENNTHVQRITPEIMAPYKPEPERQNYPDFAFPREPAAFEPVWTLQTSITRAMIDCNHHVHNVAYLDLALEALPAAVDMDAFSHMTVVYRRQILPGERVKLSYGMAGSKHIVTITEAETNTLRAFFEMEE